MNDPAHNSAATFFYLGAEDQTTQLVNFAGRTISAAASGNSPRTLVGVGV